MSQSLRESTTLIQLSREMFQVAVIFTNDSGALSASAATFPISSHVPSSMALLFIYLFSVEMISSLPGSRF